MFCLGEPLNPPTPKSKQYVKIMKILIIVQIIISFLDCTVTNIFLKHGIFGFFMAFIIYISQHQLSYQLTSIFLFTSIYFSIQFLISILTSVQANQYYKFKAITWYYYSVAIISFVYYLFLAIFTLFPYRQFKSIVYRQNQTIKAFFRDNTNANTDSIQIKLQNIVSDQILYNQIKIDPRKRNNDNGSYQIQKGRGIVI